jgi:hypothetical protein
MAMYLFDRDPKGVDTVPYNAGSADRILRSAWALRRAGLGRSHDETGTPTWAMGEA